MKISTPFGYTTSYGYNCKAPELSTGQCRSCTPKGGTTSHGCRRESAIKLSNPLQKGEYLTSALHGKYAVCVFFKNYTSIIYIMLELHNINCSSSLYTRAQH